MFAYSYRTLRNNGSDNYTYINNSCGSLAATISSDASVQPYTHTALKWIEYYGNVAFDIYFSNDHRTPLQTATYATLLRI